MLRIAFALLLLAAAHSCRDADRQPRQVEDPSACHCVFDVASKRTICNSACPPGTVKF